MAGLPSRVILLPGLLVALAAGASDGVDAGRSPRASTITIDYPEDGSIFPPEITPPTFLWRDGAKGVAFWRIDVSFGAGAAAIHATSKGERLRIGRIDPDCVAVTNEPPRLTPQLAAAHSWTPDRATWQAIKRHSVGQRRDGDHHRLSRRRPGAAVSRGKVAIRTSKDPVGAPIFYRDVPLMPSELEKGVIKPLAAEAMPLVAWRVRNVGEAAQPGGDGEPAGVRQLPFLLRATARPWEWISMACRTTGECTSWRSVAPRRWRSASRT